MEKLRISRPVIVEGKYDKITLSSVMEGTILTTHGFSVFNQKERVTLLRRLAAEKMERYPRNGKLHAIRGPGRPGGKAHVSLISFVCSVSPGPAAGGAFAALPNAGLLPDRLRIQKF